MSITAKELYEATLKGEGILAKHARDNPEMPVFLLIAQDCHAADLIEKWTIWVNAAIPTSGGKAMMDKVAEARVIVDRMRSWPIRKHPD